MIKAEKSKAPMNPIIRCICDEKGKKIPTRRIPMNANRADVNPAPKLLKSFFVVNAYTVKPVAMVAVRQSA